MKKLFVCLACVILAFASCTEKKTEKKTENTSEKHLQFLGYELTGTLADFEKNLVEYDLEFLDSTDKSIYYQGVVFEDDAIVSVDCGPKGIVYHGALDFYKESPEEALDFMAELEKRFDQVFGTDDKTVDVEDGEYLISYSMDEGLVEISITESDDEFMISVDYADAISYDKNY